MRDTKNEEKPSDQIQKTAQKLIDKTEARVKAGRDEFEAQWQAALESHLLALKDTEPGQLYLISHADDKGQWEFYWGVLEKMDLPPDTIALLVPSEVRTEAGGKGYQLIISGYEDHKIIIAATLPGLKSVGIDVFDDGQHLADYSYYTIGECLDDLSNVIWVFFKPKGDWTKDQITQYTENWFLKNESLDLEGVNFHTEYSYAHHPELIGSEPVHAALRLVGSCISRKYESLDKMIETFNEVNRDISPEEPVITHEALMEDDPTQCQAFFDCITAEMDMDLDVVEYIDGVSFDRGTSSEFRDAFDKTANLIYQTLTGRQCPKTVRTEWT